MQPAKAHSLRQMRRKFVQMRRNAGGKSALLENEVERRSAQVRSDIIIFGVVGLLAVAGLGLVAVGATI